VTRIKTPSGLQAELLIKDAWGPEKKCAGLRYIGDDARRRLGGLFTNCDDTFDCEDIAEDMAKFRFGFADTVPDINRFSIRGAVAHLFPVISVDDKPSNAIWHFDKLSLQTLNAIRRIDEPSAITMLYADTLDSSRIKETGFGHPQVIADAYNDFEGEDVAEGNALSLRNIFVNLGTGWENTATQQTKTEFICDMMQATYTHSNKLCKEHGIVGTHWIPHAQGRMILFGNDIVHCSDLIKQGNFAPRRQEVWRRIFPGRNMMGFNRARS